MDIFLLTHKGKPKPSKVASNKSRYKWSSLPPQAYLWYAQ